MKFEKLIKRARLIAPNIDERSKSRHISFLLKRNKIISYGWNRPWHGHPLANRYGARHSAVHSELSALIRSDLRFSEVSGLTMVNIRFLKDGTVSLSKPCAVCQNLLRAVRIEDIYFTDQDGIFQRM